MISFEEFVMEAGAPIYQQILLHIKRGIVAGTVEDGDELPSRRVLSALLGVNPNTVQNAFAQLEQKGVLYSVRGLGWFVSEDTVAAKSLFQELVQEKVAAFFGEMTALGISPEEIKEIVKEWEIHE